MSDTIRTLAATLAALADNTSGAITPQVLRDAIVSVFGVYGELTVLGGTGSTSATSSWDKFTNWSGAGPTNGLTVDYATNRRITCPVAGVYEVGFYIKATYSGGAGVRWGIVKNGAATPEENLTVPVIRSQAGDDVCYVSGFVTLAANDYLEVFKYYDAGSMSIYPKTASLRVRKIG